MRIWIHFLHVKFSGHFHFIQLLNLDRFIFFLTVFSIFLNSRWNFLSMLCDCFFFFLSLSLLNSVALWIGFIFSFEILRWFSFHPIIKYGSLIVFFLILSIFLIYCSYLLSILCDYLFFPLNSVALKIGFFPILSNSKEIFHFDEWILLDHS